MQLARHSDPKLTAKRYGRAQLHDLAGTVEKMASILGGNPAPESLPEAIRATGTDNAVPKRVARALHMSVPADEKTCESMRKMPSPVTADCHRDAPHETQGLQADEATCERMRQAPPEGLEPSTYGLENRCSIRLSYGGVALFA